jgi:hypothetical protein
MSPPRPDTDALQARVATRLVGVLSAAGPALPADVTERLRFARQAALQRARQGRHATAAVAAAGGWRALTGGAAGVAGPGFDAPVAWWQRAMALLPLLVLAAGLVGIDHWAAREQITLAADIDAALLADDLPPEAYADPGFAQFLVDEPADAAP